MKIDSKDMTVDSLFSQGWYRIPRFQRPYSWEDGHISDFWRDTVIENNGEYFIGSMVIYDEGGLTFGIVDGQQRITTITIMLCALRDVFYELNENGLGDGVHTKIEKLNIESESEFVLKTDTSFPYLQTFIQDKNSNSFDDTVSNEERNIAHAYSFYRRKFKSLSTNGASLDVLKSVRKKILELKIVLITLEDEEDAYLVFEILNARGQDLDAADLIKNHLLRLIKKNNASYDRAQEIWKNVVRTIQSREKVAKIEDFLYHFWLSKYKYVTKKDLYKSVKLEISTSAAANKIVSDLTYDAKIYAMLIDPQENDWERTEYEIFNSLKAFSIFGIKQQIPAVLTLLRSYKKKEIKFKDVKRGLKHIEHFHFIFTAICSERSSGSISTMYSSFGINIFHCDNITSIRKEIHELYKKMKLKLPSYSSFLSQFELVEYRKGKTRQRKLVNYILKEFYKHDSTSGVYPERNIYNIEHLMAQSTALSTEDKNAVGKIGNLFFCPQDVNSQIGTKDFSEKKTTLLDNKCLLPPDVVESSTWGKNEINKRTKNMASVAYNTIWKL